ncbi:hypothetical protein D3C72_2475450 [compost metagenome]
MQTGRVGVEVALLEVVLHDQKTENPHGILIAGLGIQVVAQRIKRFVIGVVIVHGRAQRAAAAQ